MPELLTHLFSSGPFIPHGHCYLWKPELVWLHVVADSSIALAYYSIPLTLFYFVQKREDLPFNWIFLLFGAFIVACGTTHLMEVWTLWYPTYWLSGGIKALTAGISLFTAIQLFPLMPKALTLPSPAQLATANRELQAQIQERLNVEEELRKYQNQLEELVSDRTAELVQTNARLQQEIIERQAALSERQRTEVALRQSEEQFRQLAENIHEVFWIIACDNHQMIYISPAYEKIWGRSCDSLYQQPQSWMESVHPEDRERVLAAFVSRVPGIVNFNEEYRIIRPDHSIRWIWAREYPIQNETGEVYRVAGIAEDITERKQVEQERERLLAREKAARTQAEMANRMKDEFLSILSHELRTPLNAILGWTQMLRSHRHLDEAVTARALETIERNARGQATLIEDLLDISRIITGKLRLSVCPVNLVAVIEAAIDTVRPAAEAKSIRLQPILDPQAGPVSGDPDRLQQIVWNLLANAIKFTPKGGRVQVRLERINSHVEVVVSDTGQGINPDFLPYVFDRFQQEDSSVTRKHGGLGLGLAIVRHLTELHGGNVKVYSPGEGLGATFVVELPLSPIHSPETGERVHPTVNSGLPCDHLPSLEGLHILVVDDEADARDLLVTILTACGAEATAVSSVREAMAILEHLQPNQPDLLVSDIGMPGENGYDLIKQIRALNPEQGGQIPAVALTAYARVEDRTRALSAGFQMHIAKPVNLTEFVTVIASLTGRTHPFN